MIKRLPGQAAEHEADHGEAEEGSDGASVALEVSHQAAIAARPSEGSFDNPTLGENDEVVGVGALDDLDGPAAGIRHRLCRPWALIAGIGEDALDEREGPARLAKNFADAVAILDVGRMNNDAQQQTERVDEDVALAARDLLARIIALRPGPL